MTRQNKAGLAVAVVFLTLVTTVGVMKWRGGPNQSTLAMSVPPAIEWEPEPKAAKVRPRPVEKPKPVEEAKALETPTTPAPGAVPSVDALAHRDETSIPNRISESHAVEVGMPLGISRFRPITSIIGTSSPAPLGEDMVLVGDVQPPAQVPSNTPLSMPDLTVSIDPPPSAAPLAPLPADMAGKNPTPPVVPPLAPLDPPAGGSNAMPSIPGALTNPMPVTPIPVPDSKNELLPLPAAPGAAPLPPVEPPVPLTPPVREFVGPPAPPNTPPMQPVTPLDGINVPPAPPVPLAPPPAAIPPVLAPLNPPPPQPMMKEPTEKTSSGTPLEGSRFVPTVTVSPPRAIGTQPPTAGNPPPKADVVPAGNREPVKPPVAPSPEGLQTIATPFLPLQPTPVPSSQSRSTLLRSSLPDAQTGRVQIGAGGAAVANTPKVNKFETSGLLCKPGDTWESVSEKELNTKGYTEALRAFNMKLRGQSERIKNGDPLQPGDVVHIPNTQVLEGDFPTLIRRGGR